MILSDFFCFLPVFLTPLTLKNCLEAVFLLVFLVSFFTLIFNPALNNLILELGEKINLIKANSYLTAVVFFSDGVGYSLAGVLVANLDYPISFCFNSLTYIYSRLILFFYFCFKRRSVIYV